MSDIKTWVKRCLEYRDHQSGMVSDDMIQNWMQEEIDDLREENERLRADNAELQRSFDDGYRVLEATQQANDKLRADNERLREMLLDIAVELRGEEPRIVFQIRQALESKP